MRLTPFSLALCALLWSALAPSQSAAQGRIVGRPNVFFDCDGRNCRSEYYRTEINWVNWVRDRTFADVHVIMTSTSTGVGGQEYQLDFSGVEAATGTVIYEDQLHMQTLPTDTERESLDAIAHTLALGLARYANTTGYRNVVTIHPVDVDSTRAEQGIVSDNEVNDPWNLWFFRLNGNGNLDGESTSQTVRLFSSFSASRVTPTWKLNFRTNANLNRVEFDLDDGTFTNRRTDWAFNQLTVYAFTDHFSVGLQSQAARMTRFNQQFRFEMTPAVEYSYFPYEEATRRALTVYYKIGPAYRDYIEPTVFGETSETRFEQALEIEFSQRQTWGEASFRVLGSHFLHDFDRNNLSVEGDLDFRIVRGLSIRFQGEVGFVDDQIYLPAEGVTDEEALLRLRQQATDFNYGISVGFSFQFGSIYNNVVNNRFRGAPGARFF
ncbi:MAG: hypothetical protein ACR2QM_15320 [Longimicrobiales bacterium]